MIRYDQAPNCTETVKDASRSGVTEPPTALVHEHEPPIQCCRSNSRLLLACTLSEATVGSNLPPSHNDQRFALLV